MQIQNAAVSAFAAVLPVLPKDQQARITAGAFGGIAGTADGEVRAAGARAAAGAAACLPADSVAADICLQALLGMQHDSDVFVREVGVLYQCPCACLFFLGTVVEMPMHATSA